MSDNSGTSVERNLSRRMILHGLGATLLTDVSLMSPNKQASHHKITQYKCCTARNVQNSYVDVGFVEVSFVNGTCIRLFKATTQLVFTE